MTDDRVTLAIACDLGSPENADWRFRAIDRDGIDALPGTLGAEVELADGRRIPLETFDDLAPDGLATRLPDLAGLLAARDAAGSERDVRRIAAEAGAGDEIERLLAIGGGTATPPPPPPPPPPPKEGPSAEESARILDDILAARPSEDLAADSLERLFREAAAAAIPVDSAAEERHRWAVDRSLGWRLRTILHDPAFRRVESSWRSLRTLVREADTGPDLRLIVLPVAAESLRADLVAAFESDEPSTLQLALESARDRWGRVDALFLGLDLGCDEADLRAVAGLSRVARAIGCPAIADARPELVGLTSVADLPDHRKIAAAADAPGLASWRTFRETALAGSVGLCLPRILSRLPYGPHTAPVERFDFDETNGAKPFTRYTWGSPALALARVAAAAFVADGRGARLAPHTEIRRLPVHVLDEDDEVVGPTEAALPDSAALQLRVAGFIPLQSIRGTDAARFVDVLSVAHTGTPLFGRGRQ